MIGFLGGTGPEGRGLALRFALAGEEIMLGSRDLARAEEAVQRMKGRVPIAGVWAATNASVAQEADTVFVTVPYEAQPSLLEPLAASLVHKVVVSTVAPLAFDQGRATALPVPEGSVAAQTQRLLPESQVVAAFQNVSAVDLWVPDRPIEGDVVVCSDYEHPKEEVMALAQRIPNLRAVDGGALANARYVEEITALLLNINRIYKARTMIRIVGLESHQKDRQPSVDHLT
ncbi:MAG: NADPH-dependent F420 reductase [Dehalococcoidia bacterium]